MFTFTEKNQVKDYDKLPSQINFQGMTKTAQEVADWLYIVEDQDKIDSYLHSHNLRELQSCMNEMVAKEDLWVPNFIVFLGIDDHRVQTVLDKDQIIAERKIAQQLQDSESSEFGGQELNFLRANSQTQLSGVNYSGFRVITG